MAHTADIEMAVRAADEALIPRGVLAILESILRIHEDASVRMSVNSQGRFSIGVEYPRYYRGASCYASGDTLAEAVDRLNMLLDTVDLKAGGQ